MPHYRMLCRFDDGQELDIVFKAVDVADLAKQIEQRSARLSQKFGLMSCSVFEATQDKNAPKQYSLGVFCKSCLEFIWFMLRLLVYLLITSVAYIPLMLVLAAFVGGALLYAIGVYAVRWFLSRVVSGVVSGVVSPERNGQAESKSPELLRRTDKLTSGLLGLINWMEDIQGRVNHSMGDGHRDTQDNPREPDNPQRA